MYDYQKKILHKSADIVERQTRAARHLQAEELKRTALEAFRQIRNVLSHMFGATAKSENARN